MPERCPHAAQTAKTGASRGRCSKGVPEAPLATRPTRQTGPPHGRVVPTWQQFLSETCLEASRGHEGDNASCATRSFLALAAAAFLSSPVGPSMKRPWQKRRNSILLVRRRWRRKLVRKVLDVPTVTRRHRSFRRRRYPPWSRSTWATGAT